MKGRIVLAVMVALSILCFAVAANCSTIYVKYDANGLENGTSWTDAYTTVSAGLSAAQTGDEVWVAGGAYVGCVTLPAGVELYGGFSGNTSLPGERDLSLYETVLDGNQAGSVVTVGTGATSSDTVIDGFTIRNGIGTVVGSYHHGGGIYCNGAFPTISHNIIAENHITTGSGGGIYVAGVFGDFGAPVITDNVIKNNSSSYSLGGSAIYLYNVSALVANNKVLWNTTKYSSGAIRFNNNYSGSYADLEISNNTITGNVGGGIYGGETINCTSLIRDNVISANSKWGVNFINTQASSKIVNNTVASNAGVALYCGGSLTVANNIVAFNAAGISCSGGSPVFSHNCVWSCQAYNYFDGTQTYNLPPGTGNISSDPQFASPDYGNLHIQSGSPCIGAGDPNEIDTGWTDIDDQGFSGTVDIGADEYHGETYDQGPYAIVRVDPDGDDGSDGSGWSTAAKETIQAAIDAAAEVGGQVWVKGAQSAGITYSENITLRPYVYVRGGYSGSADTRDFSTYLSVLDGNQQGSVVDVRCGYLVGSMEGFTIQNGSNFGGGGVYAVNSSAIIADNIITGNNASAGNGGGGIYLSDSSSVITRNRINGNTAAYGAGIRYESTSGVPSFPQITSNIISGNTASSAGGGIQTAIASNSISVTEIVNNTIVGNTATNDGGGIYYANNNVSDHLAYIENNIIASNSSGIYSGTYVPIVTCNDVYGNTGYDYSWSPAPAGNISSDPQFEPGSDYHISATSPCRDAGCSSAPGVGDTPLDIDLQSRIFPTGGSIDIGADEYVYIATPTFTPDGGTYDSAQTVTIACGTTGADIYYTTNGDEPIDSVTSTNFAITNGSSVQVSDITRLKAKAFLAGCGASDTKTADYYCGSEVVIPDPDSTLSWPFPLNGTTVARTQTIYLSSEIGDACTINSLALDVTSVPSSRTFDYFTVRMKTTSLSEFVPGSCVWEPAGSWQVVYQGTEQVSSTGWKVFNFSTPFDYDGSQNLMVDISYENQSSGLSLQCRRTEVNAIRTMFGGGSPDPLTWSGTTPTPMTLPTTPNDYAHSVVNIKLDTDVPTVATPTFAPDGGTYNAAQTVTVSCTTGGAVIHYTTDGSDPTETDPTVASGGNVAVDCSMALKAKAFKTQFAPSQPKEATYLIQVETPTLTPGGGTYNTAQTVTVSCATAGAVIHYTTDGSDPTETDPTVASGGNVTVDQSLTLKVKAFKECWTPSAVASGAYILQVLTPTFDPGAGNVYASQDVSVGCATTGAVIHYTTDGTEPTEIDPLVVGGYVHLDASATLKAKAWKNDWASSEEASAAYTVVVDTPTFGTATGRYDMPINVVVSCAAAGAAIHYTTTGVDPTETDPVVASGSSVMIDQACTLKARAFKLGCDSSAVVTGYYDSWAEFVLGDTASTLNWPFPLNGTAIARTQTIYLSSEIDRPCQINSLALDITSVPSSRTFDYFTIRMKTTSLSEFVPGSCVWEPAESWQVVYQGTEQVSSTGWKVFDLSTPFDYDGCQNLMVDISYENQSSSLSLQCRRTEVNGIRTMFGGGSSDPLTWSGTTPTPMTLPTTPDDYAHSVVNVKLNADVLTVATPTFTPDAGTYNVEQAVTVNCATCGAVIYYTTDGSEPDSDNPNALIIANGGTVSIGCTDTTLKAKAFKEYCTPSNTKAATYILQVDTPTLSLAAGTYNTAQTVTVYCTTPGAAIHYTTDGSEPTESDPTIADGGTIAVDCSMTLKAKAFRSCWTPSEVASETYTLQVETPTLTPVGGTYNTAQTVTVSSATAGAVIHYTTDGSDPTESDPSVANGGTVAVDCSMTLKAKAFYGCWTPSEVASETYTLQVLTPTLTPVGGTYNTAQTVTVSSATAGAVIHYTTDGSDPTESDPSVANGGTVAVGCSMTLKAKAFRSCWTPSEVASETYTLQVLTPTLTPVGGTYNTAQTVTVSSATAGAVIHYTTDGSDPTESDSSVANGGTVVVGCSMTLKAKAFRSCWTPSGVASETYTLQVLTPTITALGNSQVQLNCATTGAEIHYTIDGGDPTSSDPYVYSGGTISVPGCVTVKARASIDCWDWSDLAEGYYCDGSGTAWPMFHYDNSLCGCTPDPIGSNLAQEWMVTLDGDHFGYEQHWSSPVISNGWIYVGTNDGTLYKVPTSGDENLEVTRSFGSAISGAPCCVDDYVYIGTANGYLHKLDADDLTDVWQQPYYCGSGSGITGSPNVWNGTVYIGVIGTYKGIHSVNDADGTALSGSPATSVYKVDYVTPSIDPTYDNGSGHSNGRVYVSDYSCYVTAAYCDTGAFRWDEHWDTVSMYASPVVYGGYIYVGSNYGGVYQVQDMDSYGTPSFLSVSSAVRSTPAVYNDCIYFGADNGNLYCVDTNDFSSVERYWDLDPNSSSPIKSSPAVSSSTGMLYVATENGWVYGVDLNSSSTTPVWSHDTGKTIKSSPAIAEGRLFIVAGDSTNRYLYCFEDQ